MSILAGTLAQLPVLCWELADATGPAAADASGSGHPGVYGGATFSLQQPGPEVGTNSALFTGTGGVQTPGPTPVGLPAWSFQAWIGARQLNSIFPNLFAQQNAGAGEAIYFANNQISEVQQGIRNIGLGVNVNDGNWHQYVWTRDLAALVTLYVDGLVAYTAPGTTVGLPVGGPFQSGLNTGTDAAFFYCVALWSTALTGAQVNAMFAAATGPLQQPANINTVSGADISTLLGDLVGLLQWVTRDLRTTP